MTLFNQAEKKGPNDIVIASNTMFDFFSNDR